MEDKRAFMRIPTRLTGYLRLLPAPDDMQLFRETPFLGGASAACRDLREAGMSEALQTLLCTIDAKLDMLLAMQGRDALTADFPVAMEIVEISGAGLRFTSATELPADHYAEAVVVLSRFPLRMAGAVGRVLRHETTPDERTAYALDFTRIRERDLENIVQFVFQSQRDDLHARHWD